MQLLSRYVNAIDLEIKETKKGRWIEWEEGAHVTFVSKKKERNLEEKEKSKAIQVRYLSHQNCDVTGR